MKKTKQKKKNNTFTKKKLISYCLITICLGTFAYFLGSGIAKQVMKSQHQKEQKMELNDLTDLDSLENISLSSFLEGFNQLVEDDYQIEENQLEDGKIKINSIDFSFIRKEQNLEIVAVDYQEESEEIKKIIIALIRANNEAIDEESANLLYTKTKETLDQESGSSQYFQYKGCETSLKKKGNTYQFRIGRITK